LKRQPAICKIRSAARPSSQFATHTAEIATQRFLRAKLKQKVGSRPPVCFADMTQTSQEQYIGPPVETQLNRADQRCPQIRPFFDDAP
jgi:hypothetical protein